VATWAVGATVYVSADKATGAESVLVMPDVAPVADEPAASVVEELSLPQAASAAMTAQRVARYTNEIRIRSSPRKAVKAAIAGSWGQCNDHRNNDNLSEARDVSLMQDKPARGLIEAPAVCISERLRDEINYQRLQYCESVHSLNG
jgi:hypothetical protein